MHDRNKLWLAVFASAILALIVSVFTARRVAESYPIAAPTQRPVMGAIGGGFTGIQTIDPFGKLEQQASSWHRTFVTAGACVNIDTSNLNAQPGELADYWGMAKFDHDNIDASTNCDGGVCSSTIRRFFPSDYHGGQMCRAGGGPCGTTGIDVAQDSYTSLGDTAQLYFTGTAVALQGCCGSTACWVSGQMVSQHQYNTVFDSGTDASDASDASDAADAGPPVVTALYVPMGSANGGETIAFEGSNFGALSSTGCTFGGLAGTSPTVVSSTVFTCKTPTSGLSESSTPISAIITGPSGNSAAQNFYVNEPSPSAWGWPGTTSGGVWSGDWTVSSTHITSWPDQSGNGNTLSAGACSAQPTVSTAFNSSTWNGEAFSSQCLQSSLANTAQPFTVCLAFQSNSTTGTQIMTDGTSLSHADEFGMTTEYLMYAGSSVFQTGSGTAVHFGCAQFNTTNSVFDISGSVSGSVNPGSQSLTGFTLGGNYTGGANFFSGTMLAYWIYPIAVSGAHLAILYANVEAVAGSM